MLLTATLFPACNSETDKTETQTINCTVLEDSVAAKPKEKSSTPKTDWLAALPVRHFPIIDSTSFDNFKKSGIPDNGFLKRIKFKPEHTDTTNFSLNYKIPFAENFTALVVTYQSGDNELFTTLITVSKGNKIIDRLDVAYDEVAESAFRKTSKIEKDNIVITAENWMSEEPIFETKTYILQADGKFKMVQSHTK